MARNFQSLLRTTLNVFNKSITQNICVSGTRTLYAATVLGLDSYQKQRENVEQQFLSMSDKFREKMLSFVDGESKNMVFTEDLKNMLHLANDNPTDLELLSKMLIKFNKQNKELRFGSFVFGPVVMRTYYYLDKTDEALAAFNNPELEGFFNQVVSCQILMDLLYNHGRYAEIRQVFDTIESKNILGTSFPKDVIVLVFAACYKENSSESFEYALNCYQKLKMRGNYLVRRAATFFAGLALKQGRPEITAEVMFNEKQFNYVSVRLLKVAALSDLDRLDDVLPILRNSLSNDRISQIKHLYPIEVLDKVEKAIERAQLDKNDPMVTVVRQLKSNDHIETKTLDDVLCTTIIGRIKDQGQYKTPANFRTRAYNPSERTRRPYNEYQRTGLKDLV
ncbi:pentatricopeptide repeat-containing protein 2, mitochondrial [Neodiprion pinetum]|uniref:pentatricopeptide repeat-containing protein 2, mitochondrial n=1 Tax=Neodiprion pinetum TaxID=441929 RepID=UPI001EDCC395|nr:pentatricopeptide repeat-containing protein 2, mitochondrial-like [Neodiprion pinetum]